MLAHKDISYIKYPAIAQTKMDGARAHLAWDGENAIAWSRQGKQFALGDVFNNTMFLMFKDTPVTIDGELLFTDGDGNFLDRKTSNGLANKANKGTISEAEAARAVYVAWDIVDFSGTIPYGQRFEELTLKWNAAYSDVEKVNIQLVKSKMVNDTQEAQLFFQEQLAAGEEGAVLKNIKSLWVPKRSRDLGKMKASEEADLKIVSLVEGTGKYFGMLGAIEYETEDGLVTGNVGTGLTDFQRKQMWAIKDTMIGKIITVKYNQLIEDRDGNKSLFLPVFIEGRFDKTVANTLDELK
jgi:ATP-dependent DNA ligase